MLWTTWVAGWYKTIAGSGRVAGPARVGEWLVIVANANATAAEIGDVTARQSEPLSTQTAEAPWWRIEQRVMLMLDEYVM